ncbi:ABC transporter ATP-binding protein [Pseudonocardia sp. NPDC049635]|uniref:ABC transporter ATP-binding protein n=1 Tax=Pseudonocardia sp. NPDC049635 TaxID=3155506 RepID=UPI0033EBE3FF
MTAALAIEDAVKTFGGHRALDGVDLVLPPGEALGVIGESGSGKSTLARAVLGLHPLDSGRIRVGGLDVRTGDRAVVRELRRRVSMVFQEPRESLNPRMTIAAAVSEPLRVHEPGLGPADRRRRVLEALDLVSLPAALAERHPGALSGGQQQRVSIARALVTQPTLLVLDEPTSALDLSIQAQVLTLLRRLHAELGLTYVFVSHDIDAVGYVCDRVAVMLHGRIVECAPTEQLLTGASHPYSKELLGAALSPRPA